MMCQCQNMTLVKYSERCFCKTYLQEIKIADNCRSIYYWLQYMGGDPLRKKLRGNNINFSLWSYIFYSLICQLETNFDLKILHENWLQDFTCNIWFIITPLCSMCWGCKNTKDFGKVIAWDSKSQYFLENDFFLLESIYFIDLWVFYFYYL